MTLKLARPRLSADLRSLCGRVANERMKASLWAEAARLRQFARQHMADGYNEIEITAWLASQIAEAQLSQRKG